MLLSDYFEDCGMAGKFFNVQFSHFNFSLILKMISFLAFLNTKSHIEQAVNDDLTTIIQ